MLVMQQHDQEQTELKTETIGNSFAKYNTPFNILSSIMI